MHRPISRSRVSGVESLTFEARIDSLQAMQRAERDIRSTPYRAGEDKPGKPNRVAASGVLQLRRRL